MSGFMDWAVNNDYFVMWLLYLLGVAGVMLVLWRLSRAWPAWLSTTVRLMSLGLLVAPTLIPAERPRYAPAIIVAPFEWLDGGASGAADAVSSLLLGAAVALLAVLLVIAAGAVVRRRAQAANEAPAGAEASPHPNAR